MLQQQITCKSQYLKTSKVLPLLMLRAILISKLRSTSWNISRHHNRELWRGYLTQAAKYSGRK